MSTEDTQNNSPATPVNRSLVVVYDDADITPEAVEVLEIIASIHNVTIAVDKRLDV